MEGLVLSGEKLPQGWGGLVLGKYGGHGPRVAGGPVKCGWWTEEWNFEFNFRSFKSSCMAGGYCRGQDSVVLDSGAQWFQDLRTPIGWVPIPTPGVKPFNSSEA